MPLDTSWRPVYSYPPDTHDGRKVHKRLGLTDWDQLCLRASALRQDTPCRVLPHLKTGLNNLVRRLEFDDGVTWLARVQLKESTQDSALILRSEVASMTLMRERTSIPIPAVYAYEADDRNSTNAAFILMDAIVGKTAMDCDGGHDVHKGQIPLDRRPAFHHSIAQIQVQMASVRLPLIGMVVQDAAGGYTVGPFPRIGGPFRAASDFIEAWAKHSQLPLWADAVDRIPTEALRARILASIEAFPGQVRASAADLVTYNDGPFPLMHTDFLHSNVMVDSDYAITGIIDWEGACTMPWELVEMPFFLDTVPPELDAPWNYDENGMPIDKDTRRTWEDRKQYVTLVIEAEHEAHADDMLSSTLSNDASQKLAFAMRVYTDPGKLLFYDRVITNK